MVWQYIRISITKKYTELIFDTIIYETGSIPFKNLNI